MLFSTPVFRPGLLNPYPFQTWYICRNEVIIFRVGLKQKDFLKSISNSLITLSMWFIWNWNDEYVHTLLYFPRKPYPIPDQNEQHLYLFSHRNGAKTIPFGAAHTYMAYIRECPPPGGEYPVRWEVTRDTRSLKAECNQLPSIESSRRPTSP